MPKTLLAVEDSATMRKVLEITFVGEDFNVLTAGDRGGLLAKLTENPSAVVIDTTLEGDDGYAICKEVRQRLPRAAIVLLASRYTPHDAARSKDAGADDYIDKPFDTQQLIDKVKKAIGAREAAAPEPVSRAEAPYRQPAPAAPSPPAPPVHHAPPAPAARPAYQPGPAPQRSGTLMFSVDGPGMPPAPGAAPAPPAPHAPAPPPAPPKPVAAPMAAKPPAPAPVVPAPAAATAHVAAATNGQLAPKLAQLGLTPAQVDGVLALSREVVEQVVWEVVPQLAEALIKEEIARLTKSERSVRMTRSARPC